MANTPGYKYYILPFLASLITCTVWASSQMPIQESINQTNRSFVVDCQGNQFLKDGRPFRFVAGEMHYFRIPPVYWKDRLLKLKAAGLNALQTYVEWRLHEPRPGLYNFKENADLVAFIKLAQSLNLVVIIRLGPYIDAERDMGGLPWWLLSNDPEIPLRQLGSDYINFVDQWYSVLLPKLEPLLYGNGGPIIMAQIENEYGSYYACDKRYLVRLRNIVQNHFGVGDKVLLYSTDGDNAGLLNCGKIPGVYATVDFGAGANVTASFAVQRRFEPCGPHVNSEFYPGWLDLWGISHQTVKTEKIINTLQDMLDMNASVSFYVFHGGSSFGLSNGAVKAGRYRACITSYDYDAPLSEAGDPTAKYYAIREVLKNNSFKVGPLPPAIPKYNYGTVTLTQFGNLFSLLDFAQQQKRSMFLQPNRDGGNNNEWMQWTLDGIKSPANLPVTFEQLNFGYGFLLFQVEIQDNQPSPTVLDFCKAVRDRAYVFVDQEKLVGIVNRDSTPSQIAISLSKGQTLQILVENMGRYAVGNMNDPKGILSNITLNKKVLTDWEIRTMPFDSTDWLFQVIKSYKKSAIFTSLEAHIQSGGNNLDHPTFYSGSFVTPSHLTEPLDTFINMDGWKKGYLWINQFLLGRYWPAEGPQVTLYVPKTLLKPPGETNEIVIFELEYANAPKNNITRPTVTFTTEPILNGSVADITAAFKPEDVSTENQLMNMHQSAFFQNL